MNETAYGTLQLWPMKDRVLITGPRPHLSALRKHLELCGLRPEKRRHPQNHSVFLEVEGPKLERVRGLLDAWTY